MIFLATHICTLASVNFQLLFFLFALICSMTICPKYLASIVPDVNEKTQPGFFGYTAYESGWTYAINSNILSCQFKDVNTSIASITIIKYVTIKL